MSNDDAPDLGRGRYPDLIGRAALITGAGAGIGRAYALALAGCGVAVALVDLDPDAAEAVAAEIRATGAAALGVGADVTDPGGMVSAAARAADAFGGLDILVNNAGLHLPEWARPPTQLSVDRWRRLIDVNMLGIVNCVSACRPYLERSGHAVVVNQGSVAAHRPSNAYGISKLAVRGLTIALAEELAPMGIRVVGLAPAAVSTPSVLAGVPAERLNGLVGQQLIKRVASTDDLTGPLLFLCSSDADFITGETLCVAGGFALRV